MDEAVLALEGAIAPMDCFIDDRESRVLCSHLADGEHCATKLLWLRVQGGIARALNGTTLAELVEVARREDPRVSPAAGRGASTPTTLATATPAA